MDMTGGISTVVGGKVLVTEEEIDNGDGVGKSDLSGDGINLESQRVVCSVERG